MSQPPKFLAASNEFHELFTSMAIEDRGAFATWRSDTSKEVFQSAQSSPKVIPEVSANPLDGAWEDVELRSATDLSQEAQLPQASRFLAASPEYRELFSEMAVRRRPQHPHSPTLQEAYFIDSPKFLPPSMFARRTIPESPSPSKASPSRRPQTTDVVARRLISVALGIKMEKRKDEESVAIEKAVRVKNRREGSVAIEKV